MSNKGKKLVRRGGFTSRRHPNRYLYILWQGIRARCYNPKERSWSGYGGRGIRLYLPWHDPSVFVDAILSTIGHKPTPQHSLDRYPNNDGNYEPGNIRWATRRQQCSNTRRNRYLTFGGETFTVSDWSRLMGIEPSELYTFLKANTVEAAIKHFGVHEPIDFQDPDEILHEALVEVPDDIDLPQCYRDSELDCFLSRKGFAIGEANL